MWRALGVILCVLAVAGCGDDTTGAGGTGGATATSSASGTATASTGMAAFTLTSPELTEGGTFSTVNTCALNDPNVSPQLDWTPGPAGTQSYAIILTDKSFNDYLHWAIWDIPASTLGLPHAVENTFMPASVPPAEQSPSYIPSVRGYAGPCPPTVHTYEFAIYAIDVPSLTALDMNTTLAQALAEIQAHDIAKATLTGLGNP